MNNIDRILTTLDSYTGDMDSLNATTTVFAEELGPDWTQSIYQTLGDIPLEQRERLDHAFNYYAAVTAWNEIQSYLTSTLPLNRLEIMERVPVLQHWLSFFGEAGQNAVIQLQEKLSTPLEPQERNLINETARWGRPENAAAAQKFTETEAFADNAPDNTDSRGRTPADQDSIEINDEIKNSSQPELADTEIAIDSSAEPIQSVSEQAFQAESVKAEENPLSPRAFAEETTENTSQTDPVRAFTEAISSLYPDESEAKTAPDMPADPVDTPVSADQINSADIADPDVFDETATEATPIIEQTQTSQPPIRPESPAMPTRPQIVPQPGFLDEPGTTPQEEQIFLSEAEEVPASTPTSTLPETVPPEISEPIEPVPSAETSAPRGFPPLLQAHATDGFNEKDNPFLTTEASFSSEAEWLVERTLRQIRLLQEIQSWLGARCVHLGKIEIFSYKYYGFVVDFYRVLLKDIHSVLSDSSLMPLLEAHRPGGIKYLQDTQLYLEQEIRSAEENSESDVTPLIADDLDIQLFKKTLGVIDQSGEKEYLGPAPDGFEMIEDPYEAMQKQKQDQYKQLEKTLSVTEKSLAEQIESPQNAKTSSQTPENSVQSKMSFSFTRKKPGDGTGQQ